MTIQRIDPWEEATTDNSSRGVPRPSSRMTRPQPSPRFLCGYDFHQVGRLPVRPRDSDPRLARAVIGGRGERPGGPYADERALRPGGSPRAEGSYVDVGTVLCTLRPDQGHPEGCFKAALILRAEADAEVRAARRVTTDDEVKTLQETAKPKIDAKRAALDVNSEAWWSGATPL